MKHLFPLVALVFLGCTEEIVRVYEPAPCPRLAGEWVVVWQWDVFPETRVFIEEDSTYDTKWVGWFVVDSVALFVWGDWMENTRTVWLTGSDIAYLYDFTIIVSASDRHLEGKCEIVSLYNASDSYKTFFSGWKKGE